MLILDIFGLKFILETNNAFPHITNRLSFIRLHLKQHSEYKAQVEYQILLLSKVSIGVSID